MSRYLMDSGYANELEDHYKHTIWIDEGDGTPPNAENMITVNIRSWYPKFLVRWIIWYAIWKDSRGKK